MDVAFDADEQRMSAAPRRRGAGGRPRRPGVSDAIVSATIALAAEGGLDDITLNAVADRAGVGRPTIYRRWPSKEALLEDVITRMTEQHLRLPEEGPIRERLVEWFARAIEGVQGPLKSLYEAFFDASKAHIGSEAHEAAGNRTEGMIRAAMKVGELRSDTDPHLLTQLMFGIIWYRATATNEHMESSFAATVVDGVLNSWLTPTVAPARLATQQAEGSEARPAAGAESGSKAHRTARK